MSAANNKGWNDYHESKPMTANPYHNETDWDAWESGWLAAKEDHQIGEAEFEKHQR